MRVADVVILFGGFLWRVAFAQSVESPWVTPWSATYESDALNRLKGLEFGVLGGGGTISTVVQKEDWQTSGALRLDQTGNWIDYRRTREGVTQDDWQGNSFSKINVYTNVALAGAADWVPEYDAKGLSKKDDATSMTTKGYRYAYDAWDRLVTVRGPLANLVEEFRYNGLGQRIGWHYDNADGSIPLGPDGVIDGNDPWFFFQYNERWQQVAMWDERSTHPMEVFTYGTAGLDGYGGSSYIDDVVCRERDIGAVGSFSDRYYYLQNWRSDVVAIMDSDGTLKERVFYDAYGRPHAFSPGDIKTAGGADRPDGILDANDTWTTGSALWNKDLGNSSGAAIPDGSVTAADGTTLTNLKAAGYSAGYGILSDSAIGNRKGYAGYEFEPVLNGAVTADNKVIYHVRHRVLAADSGKWLQKDPLGYHDSMDLYEYCQSDAVDKRDPMGLTCGCSRAVSTGTLAVGSGPKWPWPIPGLIRGARELYYCMRFCSSSDDSGHVICVDEKPVACVCNNGIPSDIPGLPSAPSYSGDPFRECMKVHERVNASQITDEECQTCKDVDNGQPPRYIKGCRPNRDPACGEVQAYMAQYTCVLNVLCPDEGYCHCIAHKAFLTSLIDCRSDFWGAICDGGRVKPLDDESEIDAFRRRWGEVRIECDKRAKSVAAEAYNRCLRNTQR